MVEDNGASMADSLRAKLLIASPSLYDYFRRAVVLVLEHNEDGAMGLILNRVSETPVGQAVPDLAELAGADELVRLGGPVGPQAVIALGEFEDTSEASTTLVGSLGIVDPDRTPSSLQRMRVFAGYAGWAAGQLDGELEQDAWIVASAEPGDPFYEDDLWPVALQRKGGSFSLLATMPADPSLN
jgi:putative transcriptional regulator